MRKEEETTYTTIWRAKGITDGAATIDEMIRKLRGAMHGLEALRDAGVELSHEVHDDYAFLVTTDPKLAESEGFVDEREYG